MRITVTHPASTELAYNIVAGLQARNHQVDFHSGFYYSPTIKRWADRIPGAVGERTRRELGRRFHPGIDSSRVHFCDVSGDISKVILRKLRLTKLHKRILRLHDRRADRLAARRIRASQPEVVIAHNNAAISTISEARKIGAVTFLNQVTGHKAAVIRLANEERQLWPAFAGRTSHRLSGVPETPEIYEADCILAPSEYVRDTLLEVGVDENKIRTVPYGVNTTQFRPQPKVRRPFRVLFVGQVGLLKGVQYLLEAVRRLRIPDLETTIVGSVNGTGQGLAQYSDHFSYVPNVPHAEVHRCFSSASVFVYPTLHEGSALAIFEALSSGLPVITTPNSGSVVRDGVDGFIVPIRDIEALMDRIQRLYDDYELLSFMSSCAREQAESYSWNRYCNDLELTLADVSGR